MIRGGHRTFNKLANLPFPTVAAIDGACVGGGCETALSMDWRLIVRLAEGADRPSGDQARHPAGVGRHDAPPAHDRPRERPRHHPRGQGSRREAREEDRPRGRGRPAGDPRGLGEDVRPREVRHEKALERGSGRRSGARPRAEAHGEDSSKGPGKGIVFSKARQSVLKETKGHYPAPLAALGRRRKGLRRGRSPKALELEVEGVGSLIGTPVMRSLVGLFFRMEEVKKETGVEALGGPGAGVKPRKIGRVGVLGAGVMGGGIAQLAADKGFPTRMKDIKPEALALGYAQAARIWKEQGQEAPDDPRGVRGEDVAPRRLAGVRGLRGLRHHDRGGAREDGRQAGGPRGLGARRPRRRRSSRRTRRRSRSRRSPRRRRTPSASWGCTSSTPCTRCLSSRSSTAQKTDPEVTATVFDLAKKMGKTPVVVKDSPGFLVNRILSPYIGEAARLLLEGADSMASIDKAMRAFGMPVGPIELLDDVGIDVAVKAAGTMAAAFPGADARGPGSREARRGRSNRTKSEEGILFLRRGKTRRPRRGRHTAISASLHLPRIRISLLRDPGAVSSFR